MGYWYWRALKSAWVLDENTTNKFTLPESGLLSGLAVASVAVNEAALDDYDRPYPIQRHTKIRIVGDGNFEVVNCKGSQLKALECWNNNVSPKGFYSQVDTHYQRNFFEIPFGRKLGDMRYGLDLAKFGAGVEFEETNDYSTTYAVDGSQNLDVYGLFRKDPEGDLFADGFLRKRQIIDKDAATETQYGVRLPTKNKLRQISLFSKGDVASGVETGNPTSTANYIWLGVKSKEEYILNNMRHRTFSYFIHDYFGRLFRTHVTARSGTSGASLVDSMIYRGHLIGGIAHYGEIADIFWMTTGGDTRIKNCGSIIGGSATEGASAELHFEGIQLHGHTPLLTQDPMSEEEDWLDADEMGDVYVEVTEGHSTGNWYIVLDELQKTYPA